MLRSLVLVAEVLGLHCKLAVVAATEVWVPERHLMRHWKPARKDAECVEILVEVGTKCAQNRYWITKTNSREITMTNSRVKEGTIPPINHHGNATATLR